MGPAKYRTKPAEVEAVQWDGTGEATKKIMSWAGGGVRLRRSPVLTNEVLTVTNGDDRTDAGPGDWIVKGEHGLRVVKADEFDALYEKAGR